MPSLRLREPSANDLNVFFEQQLDPVANHMAAFTRAEPENRASFREHWTRILDDPAILKRTILFETLVAGHVLCFEHFEEQSVTYWLGREFWGQGIATRALLAFLPLVPARPIYARAASDNVGSLRVLEKCGFAIIGKNTALAVGRGEKIEETILILPA